MSYRVVVGSWNDAEIEFQRTCPDIAKLVSVMVSETNRHVGQPSEGMQNNQRTLDDD